MKQFLFLCLIINLFSQNTRYINQDEHAMSSEAVIAGNLIYIYGVVGSSENGEVPLSAEDQTTLIFEKIKQLLEKQKSSLNHIITLKSFHTDVEEIEEFNFIKKKYITSNYPSCSAIGIRSFVDRRFKIMLDIVAIIK